MDNNNLMGGGLLGRRRMMNRKDDCPYQRVEYLEVNEESGGAYIDTEYVPQGRI